MRPLPSRSPRRGRRPGLTVAAVARRLGVAPATLRTWDRRYGLGPSAHSAGAHRRYSARDVARLDLMRRLVNAGAPPGEAARAALRRRRVPRQPRRPRPRSRLTGSTPTSTRCSTTSTARTAAATSSRCRRHAASVRGLARAAMSLDSIACGQIVRDSLDRRGVVWTWDNLLDPGARRRRSPVGEHREGRRGRARALGVGDRARSPAWSPAARCGEPAAGHPRLRRRGDALAAAVRRQRRARGAAYRDARPRCPGAARRARRAIRRTGPSAVLVWAYLEPPRGGRSPASCRCCDRRPS